MKKIIFILIINNLKSEETAHVNNHQDPVLGCTLNNYDFCLNGAECAAGGICTCSDGFTGDRCEKSTCPQSQALSINTGKCIDIDQFILTAETFSLPWKRSLGKPGSNDYISAADYLEKTINALMIATLNSFVESKVISFSQIPKGVSFKIRIRLQYKKATTDPVLWYRWVKRAVDYSIIEAGHAVYINPDSLEVTDENECAGKLDNCSENAACINQIGNFNCLCNQGLVDWGEANSLRSGVDCQDPCNNDTNWCYNGGECINALKSLVPLCSCPMGFSGQKCDISVESSTLLFLLWGVVIMIIIVGTAVIVYRCIATKREIKMYHVSSHSKGDTIQLPMNEETLER